MPRWLLQPRVLALALLLGIVAVGCGGSKDDRNEIRSKLGEPDDIAFTEGPYYDVEVWSYYDKPSAGRTTYYEFHKSKNSCGGSTWSLYISGTSGPQVQSAAGRVARSAASPDSGVPR